MSFWIGLIGIGLLTPTIITAVRGVCCIFGDVLTPPIQIMDKEVFYCALLDELMMHSIMSLKGVKEDL
jgi:hypothetical protein